MALIGSRCLERRFPVVVAHSMPLMAPPLVRLSRVELEMLLQALQVDIVELWECLVSAGWRLDLTATEATGLHYNLGGAGRLIIDDGRPIDLQPHTLVIVPRQHRLRIEAPANGRVGRSWRVADGTFSASAPEAVRKFVAGDGQPQVVLICGYFNASYGAAVDPFASLSDVVIEQFDSADRLDHTLKAALAELMAQEVGMGAMTTALLTQVIIRLLSTFVELDELLGRAPGDLP